MWLPGFELAVAAICAAVFLVLMCVRINSWEAQKRKSADGSDPGMTSPLGYVLTSGIISLMACLIVAWLNFLIIYGLSWGNTRDLSSESWSWIILTVSAGALWLAGCIGLQFGWVLGRPVLALLAIGTMAYFSCRLNQPASH